MAAELLGRNGAFELTHVERLSEAAAQLERAALRCRPARPDAAGFERARHGRAACRSARPTCRSSSTAASAPRTCCSRARRSAAARRSSCRRAWPRRRDAARDPRLDRAQALERRRVRHARHDELTGLANRAAPGRALRARGRARRAPGQRASGAAVDRARPLSARGRADGQRVRRPPAVRGGGPAAGRHPQVRHAGAGAPARLHRAARGAGPPGSDAPACSPASCARLMAPAFRIDDSDALPDRERRHRAVSAARPPPRAS